MSAHPTDRAEREALRERMLRIVAARPCIKGPKNGSTNAISWCPDWLEDRHDLWCNTCLVRAALTDRAGHTHGESGGGTPEGHGV